jgi:hypothetical protein
MKVLNQIMEEQKINEIEVFNIEKECFEYIKQ